MTIDTFLSKDQWQGGLGLQERGGGGDKTKLFQYLCEDILNLTTVATGDCVKFSAFELNLCSKKCKSKFGHNFELF